MRVSHVKRWRVSECMSWQEERDQSVRGTPFGALGSIRVSEQIRWRVFRSTSE